MKAVFVLFLLSIALSANAQFYNTGQDRCSIKWKQINTDNFRLVYPDFAEQKAQNFANKLLWASRNVGAGLDSTTAKVDVVMHMESATSNAMVVWAPRRMEVHSLNSQNSYAQEWFEQLALHEYRHVVQIDKLNEGFTKVISIVFGQMGTSAVLGAYLPLWYLEGDAVAAESAFSSTGRGREASFSMPLRAQLSDFGNYSYDKATMGSYRSFVPDHYVLGYHLVTLAKKNYGDSIWRNTESFIARNPYYIVPFSHSIRKHSGMRKVAFYETIMAELKNDWTRQTSDFVVDSLLSNTNKLYTSYTNAQLINDSLLFAYKTGINEIGSFIIHNINDVKTDEQELLIPSYGSFSNISSSDNKLFWCERRFHNRWQHVKYSVLMTYDFASKKRKQLSRKTRYYYPSYNANKSTVVCVSQSTGGDYSLVFINSESGKLIREIEMPAFIKNPFFETNGNNVYYYILGDKGFELMEYNLNDDVHRSIMPASYNNRNGLIKANNCLYYVDDESGVDNIYQLNMQSKHIDRITDVAYGVGKISLWKNSIVYDDYTAKGWQSDLLNLTDMQTYDKVIFKHNYFESYKHDSLMNIQKNIAKDSLFEVSNYSKIGHLFNIHSWGPISVDVDNTNINPGLSIMSQNLLSTLELSAGYEYILSDNVNKYYANIEYKALPVTLSLKSKYQNRRKYVAPELQYKYGESYTYNETSVGIGLLRGFRFNKNAYNYYLQPNAGVYYMQQGVNDDTPKEFNPLKIFSFSYGLYGSQLMRSSYRDLQARWGQTYQLRYYHTPLQGADLGNIATIEATYYTPFVFPHAGVKAYFGYQKVEKGAYTYSNIIRLPRGYVSKGTFDAFSTQITIAVPLFYPDLSISSLAYIKRVKTYLFVDYFSSVEKYTSIGADLRFDMHILRTIAPFDLGIRGLYLTDINTSKKEYIFQFLLNVTI